MTLRTAIDTYVEFLERLSPNSLQELDALCAPDVRFRDPFNDVVGVERFRAALAKMFQDVADPRFRVTDRAISGQICYLRWAFTLRTGDPNAPTRRIEGMSEVHFNVANKIVAHLDYWDSGEQVYARIPLLGLLVRMIRRRLSIAA